MSPPPPPPPDDLPAPSTSRTLQPRATSLRRSEATWRHRTGSRPESRESSRSNSRRSSVILPTASVASFEESLDSGLDAFPDSQQSEPPASLAERVESVSQLGSSSSVKRKRGLSESSLLPATQSSCESDYTEVRELLRERDEDSVAPSSSQTDYKGKGKAKAIPSPSPTASVLILDDQDSPDQKRIDPSEGVSDALAAVKEQAPKSPEPELLASYTCPICFCPPSNATLTPCGHICCGSCLFTAVKSTIARAHLMMAPDGNVARCPVCRAAIPGWDGKGGGVIGLKVRAIFSL